MAGKFSTHSEKMQEFFMKTAFLLAQHSHCVSHRVGAVIVRDDRIISMGYNGTPPGTVNCDQVFNPTNFDRQEHRSWSADNEIHGEMNALMFAAKNDIGVKNCDIYCTLSPCNYCLKNIVMSGIKNVYYYFEYDYSSLNPVMLDRVNVKQIKFKGIEEFINLNNLHYDSSKINCCH